MLRKNLEVIVLLDLKKQTNRRKQILKFITVKILSFYGNGDHLKIKLPVLQECQHS